MEIKKEVYKKVVKNNIISFLSYSTLIGFIFLLVVILTKISLHDISNVFLSITLSLISGILIFNLLHFICKSSTLETLKKFSMDTENTNQFIRKMNLFFVICLMLSVLACIAYLILDNLIFANAINSAYSKYSFISVNFANDVAELIKQEYHNLLPSKICSTLIIEATFLISFLSLIPYQKKLLFKYNKPNS